ncbi:MAG TPA: vWA domain-containing protein [Candidatus Levybacteria bacterium]|nr:vWA domain-containing protein [Candidatus Levybacteria bacterium]
MPKKKTRKKRTLFNRLYPSRGSITFKILLAVVILGSIAFVSGIFPKNQITPQDPNSPKYKPVVEDETQQKDTLQLKTIKFEACSQTVAVEMVLDRSSSMGSPATKIENLKTASLFFVNKLTDDAPFGLITFSNTIREEYSIQPYKDIRSNVATTINRLSPDGTTYTRDALIRAKQALEIGIPKFPGRQFVLILVSDGLPVPANTQDPRTPTNIGDEIKNMGVKIFTIGITQGLGGNSGNMRSLMSNIASPNSFFEAPDTSQLENIYNQIGFQICNTAG